MLKALSVLLSLGKMHYFATLYMAKILFDITVSNDPAAWQSSHLVMEIGAHIFSYAVVNNNKRLLQLRFYELDARNNHDLAIEMAEIIAGDEILQSASSKKTFVYNFPESQLVPEAYFSDEKTADFIELFHGDLQTGITLSEKIQHTDQYNVFRVPSELHLLMQRSFTDAAYRHYYSLWVQCEQQQLASRKDGLSVMFYPNHMLVAVFKDQQLHLLQSYAYEAAEDVGYYLLNICEQLSLSPEQTSVVLSGMVEASSVLYTEIFKYFGQVELEAFPGPVPEPALRDYPDHFFSPLLKMAICVS